GTAPGPPPASHPARGEPPPPACPGVSPPTRRQSPPAPAGDGSPPPPLAWPDHYSMCSLAFPESCRFTISPPRRTRPVYGRVPRSESQKAPTAPSPKSRRGGPASVLLSPPPPPPYVRKGRPLGPPLHRPRRLHRPPSPEIGD